MCRCTLLPHILKVTQVDYLSDIHQPATQKAQSWTVAAQWLAHITLLRQLASWLAIKMVRCCSSEKYNTTAAVPKHIKAPTHAAKSAYLFNSSHK